MAFKKQIMDTKGNLSTYFRVVAIIAQYQKDMPIITVQLFGYADELYREKEKQDNFQDLSNSFKEIYLAADDEKGYSRADVYKRLAVETTDFADAVEI
jgi:hypothetical protein